MTKDPIAELLKKHQGEVLKLDLGCGDNKEQDVGWIGMDVRALLGVDVVQDLQKFPWPFADGTFSLLSAHHVIEHLDPTNFGFIKFMNECWRVLKYDGQFRISTPYAGNTMWWSDPTHLMGFVPQTFHHFDPLAPMQTYRVYEAAPWKINQVMWAPDGNLEVLLSKRRDDPSYHKDKKIHYV